MNTMELVRFVERAHPRQQAPRPAAPLFYAKLIGPVRQAILRARQLLLSTQQPVGSWFGDPIGGRALPRYRRSRFVDTLLAVQSLRASGLPTNHRAVIAAMTWLSRTCRFNASFDAADLAIALRMLCSAAETTGQFANALPPVLEVTHERSKLRRGAATANKCLNRLRPPIIAIVDALARNQQGDGGWGTADVTGIVLEAISLADCGNAQPAIIRAIGYLRAEQRANGSWVTGTIPQQISATSAALAGLSAAGVSSDEDVIEAGLSWLAVNQQPGGNWAEPELTSHAEFANDTYDDRFADCVGVYTAWALLAFAAAGRPNHPAALRAVNALIDSQNDRGGWDEPYYLLRDASADRRCRNDVHAAAWPLLALSRWAMAAASAQSAAADTISLRLVGATPDN